MNHSRDTGIWNACRLCGRRWLQWVNKHWTTIVLVLSSVAFTCAFFGVTTSDKPGSLGGSWFERWFNWFTDKVYEAAQVLFLNMESHRDDFNLCIGIARVVSVVLVAMVAWKAIGQLFKGSFINFLLQIPSKNSVLIAGLGRIGFELTKSNLGKGNQVVVLEIESSNFWTQSAEEVGAIVVEEDATEVDNLQPFVLRKPKEIHLVTGSDLGNINALANIKTIRQEAKRSTGKSLGRCDCHVHIEDPALHRSVLRCIIESNCEMDPDLRIHPFNIYHETACQLVIEQLTPLRPRREQVALYVIVGFEQMGQAMLKELVEFAHFENLKRSRILVLVPPNNSGSSGDAAEMAYRTCISQWDRMTPKFVHRDLSEVSFDPEMDDWACQKARPESAVRPLQGKEVEYAANVHFCELRCEHSISVSEALILARIAGAEKGNQASVKPAFLFCLEEDERNFRLATELNDHWQDFEGINSKLNLESPTWEKDKKLLTRHEEYHIPLFVFLPRSKPLRELLSVSIEHASLRPFGQVNEGLRRAHDDLVELVAIDIAYDYYREYLDEKEKLIERGDFLPVWQSKPFWEQVSNRNAAEHAHIKMQILNYVISKGPLATGSARISFEQFDEEDKDLMARIEHNRWMAERLIMGWVYGDKMNQPPQRISMCPTTALDDNEFQKDLQQVAIVFKCLEGRGVKFHRAN